MATLPCRSLFFSGCFGGAHGLAIKQLQTLLITLCSFSFQTCMFFCFVSLQTFAKLQLFYPNMATPRNVFREAAMGGSWDLAYQDVLCAFEHFLTETGERPFVLAGHSQGEILKFWQSKIKSAHVRKPRRYSHSGRNQWGNQTDPTWCLRPSWNPYLEVWNLGSSWNQLGSFTWNPSLEPPPGTFTWTWNPYLEPRNLLEPCGMIAQECPRA